MFSIFDEDGDGTIDFREFVLSLWNFCSVINASLRLFAFDLYDTDASGRIDSHEIETMLREGWCKEMNVFQISSLLPNHFLFVFAVYGQSYNSSQHASRLMEKITAICKQASEDRTIDSVTFSQFACDHPALLFPAFELQRKIQRKIMGVDFWEKHLEKRLELNSGTGAYISVKEILASKLSESAFKQLVEAPMAHHAKEAKERGGNANVNHQTEVAVKSAGARYQRRPSQTFDDVIVSPFL